MNDVKLPDRQRAILEEFLVSLKNVYGEGLVSVALYGSAASGEFTEKHSNINVIVVLTDTSLTNLARAYQVINAAKFKVINPVFFTEEYIKSSLDVFPIEFLDIQENSIVLYGKDIMKGLEIDLKNLRFQCEQEIKSKLINIKKHYVLTKNQRELESLLFKTFTSVLHIIRNLLRLKGKQPPYLKEEVLREAEKEFGVDTTVFSEILWAKNKKMALSHNDVDALLVGFVKELETLSTAVDRL